MISFVHHYLSVSLVLAMMRALSPEAPYTGNASEFAEAIAHVVEEDSPPGMDKDLAAAILVITGWEEGRYALRARRGDIDKHPFGSVCAFQVRAFSEAHAAQLESSAIACTRAAFYVLRVAATKTCPRNPIASYAGGCNVPAAQRIGIQRLYTADRIRAEAIAGD